MAADGAPSEQAVTAVTAVAREAGTSLKTAWRGQITGAGLGQRLANTNPLGAVPEGQAQPQYRRARLVEGAGFRRRP
jgi:hypothetical protein